MKILHIDGIQCRDSKLPELDAILAVLSEMVMVHRPQIILITGAIVSAGCPLSYDVELFIRRFVTTLGEPHDNISPRIMIITCPDDQSYYEKLQSIFADIEYVRYDADRVEPHQFVDGDECVDMCIYGEQQADHHIPTILGPRTRVAVICDTVLREYPLEFVEKFSTVITYGPDNYGIYRDVLVYPGTLYQNNMSTEERCVILWDVSNNTHQILSVITGYSAIELIIGDKPINFHNIKPECNHIRLIYAVDGEHKYDNKLIVNAKNMIRNICPNAEITVKCPGLLDLSYDRTTTSVSEDLAAYMIQQNYDDDSAAAIIALHAKYIADQPYITTHRQSPVDILFVEMNHFRCYESAYINVSDYEQTGLYGIFGPNRSGKSTIFMAIVAALYGKMPTIMPIDLIRSGAFPAKVRVGFKVDGINYEIIRVISDNKSLCTGALYQRDHTGLIPIPIESIEELNVRIKTLAGSIDAFTCTAMMVDNIDFIRLTRAKQLTILSELFHYDELVSCRDQVATRIKELNDLITALEKRIPKESFDERRVLKVREAGLITEINSIRQNIPDSLSETYNIICQEDDSLHKVGKSITDMPALPKQSLTVQREHAAIKQAALRDKKTRFGEQLVQIDRLVDLNNALADCRNELLEACRIDGVYDIPSEDELKDLEASLIELQNELVICKEYKKVTHKATGLPAYKLSLFITRLGLEANNILAEMGTDIIIQVEETTSKKTVPSFKASTIINNKQVPTSACSGFEQFAIAISVRLAFMRIFPSSSYTALFIDEGLDKFDENNITRLKVFLYNIATYFRYIFIISHNNIIKQFVERSHSIMLTPTTSHSLGYGVPPDYIPNCKQIPATASCAVIDPRIYQKVGDKYLCKICPGNSKVVDPVKTAHNRKASHVEALKLFQ